MTMGRTELPNAPIYVPEDTEETMPTCEWGSFLCILDGSLNPVPVSDLDQEVLKELMDDNRGLTLHHLKKRSSEYPLVTTTSNETYEEVETVALSPPVAAVDDLLSEIANARPPVHPKVLKMKHTASLAQLVSEKLDLESTAAESYGHSVLSMRLPAGPTAKVSGAKCSPNNMPISKDDIHDLHKVLWAKCEAMEHQSRINLMKRTWKSSIWCEEDKEECDSYVYKV